MSTPDKEKGRLSIDLQPEEHRQIKIYAARLGISIRHFVLECIRKQLAQEAEERTLVNMVSDVSPLLKELWNNEKDTAYDDL